MQDEKIIISWGTQSAPVVNATPFWLTTMNRWLEILDEWYIGTVPIAFLIGLLTGLIIGG